MSPEISWRFSNTLTKLCFVATVSSLLTDEISKDAEGHLHEINFLRLIRRPDQTRSKFIQSENVLTSYIWGSIRERRDTASWTGQIESNPRLHFFYRYSDPYKNTKRSKNLFKNIASYLAIVILTILKIGVIKIMRTKNGITGVE